MKGKEKEMGEPKILAAVKKEVEKEGKGNRPQNVSNACDSSCSGDNYCSDWHDAD